MSETDFLAGLSQLLASGTLRDEFAARPSAVAARFSTDPVQCAALADLSPDDLEAQARVLLRKRFRAIERLLPETCAALGLQAWPLFAQFARAVRFDGATADASAFCEFIFREDRKTLSRRELHRLRFAQRGGIVALHFLRKRPLPELQILFRLGRYSCEWLATVSL